ncbi:hypothetical protein [Prevotella sp. KH2C16]|uniref:hypothetical protein n=1 Tax=Prevotella sp. KH2C16 TaxID=1855325 RepID=UPI0008F369B6|nr:hypothetical protein [Prevotella sp. KH2C16]SFG52744.1 hypothetical protein SAMN05216383_1193 [Prevotella sp. KH2C16]
MKKRYIKPDAMLVQLNMRDKILGETLGGQSTNPVGEGGDIVFDPAKQGFSEDDEENSGYSLNKPWED